MSNTLSDLQKKKLHELQQTPTFYSKNIRNERTRSPSPNSASSTKVRRKSYRNTVPHQETVAPHQPAKDSRRTYLKTGASHEFKKK